MLTHFAIVLRPLRTPCERPLAFRRLCLLSSPLNAPQGAVLFCVIRKTVAAQPLRGCGLRSTHSSASVWFVSLGHHLHGRTWDVVFFASYAKRLQRNLCAGCPLRTPPERPSAFRRLCLPSSSPKSPDGYCYAIFALTVKLWLAVPYARRKNASAFSALLVVIPSLPRNPLERDNIKTR